jgi:hypothetical protein
MKPEVIKLLSLVVACVLYVGAGYIVDPATQDVLRNAAAALFGSQAFRRAGDLAPIKGGL